MTGTPPTLHMIFGKIASGKSTLCAKLGTEAETVVISEDDWLNALFADDMASIKDYGRCARKLRDVVGPHVVSLLQAGVSVVLDFQANTVDARNWMRGIFEKAGASHILHVLDVPDDVCLERLRMRNAEGGHAFAVTEDQFHQISRHVVLPSADEQFNVVLHG